MTRELGVGFSLMPQWNLDPLQPCLLPQESTVLEAWETLGHHMAWW